MMENYEELVAAMGRQAAREWLMARRELRRKPLDPHAAGRAYRAEKFLKGKWFNALSGIDGDELMRALNRVLETEPQRRSLKREEDEDSFSAAAGLLSDE